MAAAAVVEQPRQRGRAQTDRSASRVAKEAIGLPTAPKEVVVVVVVAVAVDPRIRHKRGNVWDPLLLAQSLIKPVPEPANQREASEGEAEKRRAAKIEGAAIRVYVCV